MPVTVRQVAAKAGVSPVVVSRVLHNKATSVRVSEATAIRVREAAKELGYRCNVLARNFRNQQTRMIGVLHGVGFERPSFDQGPRYFACLMDGVVEGAFKHGYSVTLCPHLLGSTPQEAMNDGRFDGLVWYSAAPSEENRRMLLEATVPLVVIHGHKGEFGDQLPTVICDNDQGIDLAVEHLFNLGHRRIAFALGGDVITIESFSRLTAFQNSMARRDAPVNDCDIVHISPDFEELDEFLRAKDRHTAVISHTDKLAGQILERAPKLGVRIPDQLSVIGFDSTAYCRELRPALTSVNQPLAMMGERAIDLLMEIIGGAPPLSPHVVLPCGLDIRESTSPVSI
ncbi:LacI family DNA-binding transcriptional regulator [Fimbriimonas ginsengisoli]|uniref:Transcriptional regulator, LacI family n=1 Tax=Fimbriimonas ginsengisoli Gsoil 348 TaxID=661478 RepID=A0A068NMX4_FIMGI|nr:LacI family DNA-binding transcriptional regulator [Fimbriimonas ginsengisoli]AIE84065.1 Transcriptional regulator, LacI family [Fimbriimonas ginsengisoli Gsoil 348]